MSQTSVSYSIYIYEFTLERFVKSQRISCNIFTTATFHETIRQHIYVQVNMIHLTMRRGGGGGGGGGGGVAGDLQYSAAEHHQYLK